MIPVKILAVGIWPMPARLCVGHWGLRKGIRHWV